MEAAIEEAVDELNAELVQPLQQHERDGRHDQEPDPLGNADGGLVVCEQFVQVDDRDADRQREQRQDRAVAQRIVTLITRRCKTATETK